MLLMLLMLSMSLLLPLLLLSPLLLSLSLLLIRPEEARPDPDKMDLDSIIVLTECITGRDRDICWRLRVVEWTCQPNKATYINRRWDERK